MLNFWNLYFKKINSEDLYKFPELDNKKFMFFSSHKYGKIKQVCRSHRNWTEWNQNNDQTKKIKQIFCMNK